MCKHIQIIKSVMFLVSDSFLRITPSDHITNLRAVFSQYHLVPSNALNKMWIFFFIISFLKIIFIYVQSLSFYFYIYTLYSKTCENGIAGDREKTILDRFAS